MTVTPRALRLLVVCLVVFCSVGVVAQAPPRSAESAPTVTERLMTAMHGISSHTILDWVRELTSEKYGGRLTGTPGYDAAAQWTVDLLRAWKYLPAGDGGSYLQRFPNPFTLVKPGSELTLHVPGSPLLKSYIWEQDYFQGSTSASGSVTAEVIYVGYGITAPELGYDDYAGMNVKGRIVAFEPEVPIGPEPDGDLFKKWRAYSFHEYKMRNARDHGAAGVVYDYHIANPNSVYLEGLVVTYVGESVMNDLFAGVPPNHKETVDSIKKTLKPSSRALGKTLTMANETEHHAEGVGSNVIAYLPGTDAALKDEAILVGAHLDHLGYNHELMPGAHDNASGTAVLLAVAKALASAGVPLKRTVVFILFGAEEQGVKGSEFYVAHPFVPNGKVKGFLNLESVGRGERIGLGVGKDAQSQHLGDVIARINDTYTHRTLAARVNANLARPRQDVAHFLWANVPSVSFGTGGAPPLPYATYHTTRDRWDILAPETMEDLAQMVFLATVELANEQPRSGS